MMKVPLLHGMRQYMVHMDFCFIEQIIIAIFLRIVAKCVKVPFHVQHFEGESLEYLV